MAWLAMAGLVLSVMALLAVLMRGEPVGAQEVPATVATDPGRIVFMSNRPTGGGSFDLYSMAPDGTDVQRITDRPGAEAWPSLSPDGSKIAFASQYSSAGSYLGYHDIFMINSDGTGEVNITNTTGTEELQPSWSPDGQKIAYTNYTYSSPTDIYASSATGSGGRINLTNTTNTYEYFPTWSPDGQKIAYTSHYPVGSPDYNRNNTHDVYASPAVVSGAAQRTNLTDTTGADEYWPSWSPDGQQIAYTKVTLSSQDALVYDIYTMNSDGTNQSLVVGLPGEEYFADWSPDGSRLAFSARYGSGGYDYEIFKVNANGTGVVNLTDNVGIHDYYTSWGELVDKVAPVLTLPADMSVEATGASGAAVTFVASAIDDVDGPLPVSCTPNSGHTFPLGTTTVNCEATDQAGNKATGNFKVTIVDTTAPTITGMPQHITEFATSSSGAQVSYTPPTATDLVDGNVNVVCTPASSSVFPLGTTQVSCTASDSRGNSDTKTFNVKVIYDFGGFYQPVDNNGVYNSVNAGRTVPIKFSLGGYMGMDVLSSVNPPSVKTLPKEPGVTVDAIEQTVSATTSSLSYDQTTGRYTYVWKTDKAWVGQDKQLTVTLGDGTEHIALFRFTK